MGQVAQHAYQIGDEPVTGYHLQAFLGRGGVGEVWKASGPGGVSTAIKIIHDLDRKRGLKELEALRLLRDIRHPNLVPLTAFWLKGDDGEFLHADRMCRVEEVTDANALVSRRNGPEFSHAHADTTAVPNRPSELVIAMGLAEKSLYDRLGECRDEGWRGVPVNELLTYLEDSARAIDLLNMKHDIQHCDIKPQNILLLSGAAQVCDFGLAKLVGEVRETSMGAGTIAYGAPEVLLGTGPTATTDQYSLAISYVELRTGELPYPSERVSDVLSAKQQGAVDLSQLSPAEQEVIGRAVRLAPSERFENCCEMVQALRACFSAGMPTNEKRGLRSALADTRIVRTTSVPRRPSLRRRRRWRAAGMGLAAASVVLGGAAWLSFSIGAAQVNATSEARLEEAEQALIVAEAVLERANRLTLEKLQALTPPASEVSKKPGLDVPANLK